MTLCVRRLQKSAGGEAITASSARPIGAHPEAEGWPRHVSFGQDGAGHQAHDGDIHAVNSEGYEAQQDQAPLVSGNRRFVDRFAP